MNLGFRLTIPFRELTELETIASLCEKLVVYEHIQDDYVKRTHIHAYIEGWKYTKQYLKNIVKRIKNFERTDWAFSENYVVNEERKPVNTGYITYMSKGVLEPCFVKGFTQTEIDTFKGNWTERSKPLTNYQTRIQLVKKETATEVKKRKNDLIHEMIGMMNDEEYKEKLRYEYDETVIAVIIKVLNDNKYVFSRYSVRDYYDTIQARTNTKNFITTMKYFVQYKS